LNRIGAVNRMPSHKLTIVMVNDYPDYTDPAVWGTALHERLEGVDFHVWPDRGNPAEVDLVLFDKRTPPGLFEGMRRLKAVVRLGAGIDGLQFTELPAGVPVVRLATRELASEVVQYVLMRVLARHRHLADYAGQQREKTWRPLKPRRTGETSICILGAGRIGGWAAQLFAQLGFQTAVWSRLPKEISGVKAYSGRDQFRSAVADRDYVVCTLPLTDETRGILDASAFAAMKDGAYVVNAGRGRHLDEGALLDAIQSGHIGGACLDVFQSEPLPQDSPLWSHPAITVTPHVASFWLDSGIDQVTEICHQIRAGETISDQVDIARGY
jgi:glyoxylate/hydroxypyruvate reductase A